MFVNGTVISRPHSKNSEKIDNNPVLNHPQIIIGCATAGIDLTKAPGHVDAQCAKDCQLAHVSGIHDGQMVTEGPAQHHVFGIRPQDGERQS